MLDSFRGGIYAPGTSTHNSIAVLLNTENADERDRLTELWRDNRLHELSFVDVVVNPLLNVTRPRPVFSAKNFHACKQAALAGVLARPHHPVLRHHLVHL